MNSRLLQLIVGLGALAIYLIFLVGERLVLKSARRRLRLVVHVNGTRGKSTVTRMVHAILLEAGYRAWGKTTGTEPRLQFPDGGERLIHRLGPANVREQRNMLLAAVRGGSDALVFECNAVRPELQLVSSAFLDPDLLVITNARLDHGAEQGDADAAAISFAATIPAGKALASSDTVHKDLWTAKAAEKSAQFVFVDPQEGVGFGDLPENVACAFAVSDWLGLPRDRAAKAVLSYKPDPGAFKLLCWTEPSGQRVWFADALAANDPESSDRLAQRALASAEKYGMDLATMYEMDQAPGNADRILLVALRRDRPERTRLFVDYALARCRGGKDRSRVGATLPYDKVVFVGSVPRSERRRLELAGVRSEVIGTSVGHRQAALDELCDSTGRNVFIFAGGNRLGSGKTIHDWASLKAGAWVIAGAIAEVGAQVSGKVDGSTKEASLES